MFAKILIASVFSFSVAKAACLFPNKNVDSEGRYALPAATADARSVGRQFMYKCNPQGTKSAQGANICIQFFAAVGSPSYGVDKNEKDGRGRRIYSHGAVLVLDAKSGELENIKSLNAEGQRYELYAFNTELRNGIYKPLAGEYRNRLFDAANGLIPMDMCRVVNGGYAGEPWRLNFAEKTYYFKLNVDRSTATRNKCLNKLNPDSRLYSVDAFSDLYNLDKTSETTRITSPNVRNVALSKGQELGGTYSRVTAYVDEARDILGCYPSKATQRGGGYWGKLTNRANGNSSRQ
jgi:hypothetical protein